MGKWYPGCYRGDSELHVFSVGLIADAAAVRKHGSNLTNLIEQTISGTSLVYESQLNIKLEISELEIYETFSKTPDYAFDACADGAKADINKQLDRLKAGARLSGGAVHLFTGCGNGFGVVGLAWTGAMCSDHRFGVDLLHNSMSWTTFAHELGHNFGAGHSFEEGKKKTGGLMDYGSGQLDGEYQFNTKYRKDEMCAKLDENLNWCTRGDYCDGNFGPLDDLLSGSTPTKLGVLCAAFILALFLFSGQ